MAPDKVRLSPVWICEGPYTPSIDASHDITGQLAGLGHLHQLRGLKPGPIRMHNVTWTVYYMVVPTFAVCVKCGRKFDMWCIDCS